MASYTNIETVSTGQAITATKQNEIINALNNSVNYTNKNIFGGNL